MEDTRFDDYGFWTDSTSSAGGTILDLYHYETKIASVSCGFFKEGEDAPASVIVDVYQRVHLEVRSVTDTR